MTWAHVAYLFYMSGSACFFLGTLVLWVKT